MFIDFEAIVIGLKMFGHIFFLRSTGKVFVGNAQRGLHIREIIKLKAMLV